LVLKNSEQHRTHFFKFFIKITMMIDIILNHFIEGM